MSTGATSILYSSDGYEVAVSGGSANSANNRAIPIAGSDGSNNRLITLDTSGRTIAVGAGAAGAAVVGNPLRVAGSDGTNTRDILLDSSGRIISVGAAASGAAVSGNPVLVGGSDGTNARSLRTATDGTLRIDPTGTTNQPVTVTSGTIVVTQSTAANLLATVTQGPANTLANGWPVKVTDGTNTMPTGDAVGRAIFQKITDGTNGPVAVKAASTAPVFTDPALVTVISPNQQPIPVSAAPAGATTGVVFGRTIGAAGGAITAMRATTYTEQTTNFTGSVKSTSASDASAGTGARTVTITYYDQTGAGPLTETVTLNGTTAVNLVNANHCFIEKMVVITVGSNGSNVGTISLFTGSGGTGTNVGSIGVGNASNRGDNTTLWCHHYTPASKITSIYLINAGTTGNQDADISIYSIPVLTANAAEVKISDSIIVGGNSDSISRSSPNPIKVSGFARTTMYVVANGGNTAFTGGFDYADQ